MVKSVSFVLAVGLLGAVAACSKPEPAPVYIDPDPITVEPVYTGKYK